MCLRISDRIVEEDLQSLAHVVSSVEVVCGCRVLSEERGELIHGCASDSRSELGKTLVESLGDGVDHDVKLAIGVNGGEFVSVGLADEGNVRPNGGVVDLNEELGNSVGVSNCGGYSSVAGR